MNDAELKAIQADDRATVRTFIRAIRAAGFNLFAVNDGGDELVKVATERDAMEAVFAVDDCTVIFTHNETGKRYGIYVVLGNGDGCAVNDHHADGGAFEAACDAAYELTEARL